MVFSSGRISAFFAQIVSVVIDFKFTLPNIEFDSYYHHRRTAIGAEGGCSPPRIFQIAIFGQKSGNIWAKPFDFCARNEQNIRARDFSPLDETCSVDL